MAKTKIEWSEYSWNPVTGCSKCSVGCQNCYAEKMSMRLKAMGMAKYKNGFEVTCHPECLNQPMKWKKPRDIFVCSMSDLFHEKVPTEFIRKVFRVMSDTPQHRYFVLTKRSERMKEFSNRFYGIIPGKNVVGMVTVENQEMADKRIPDLLASSFYLRGVSCEPLLSEIDLNVSYGQGVGELALESGKLSWCVIGAESGHNTRPMRPEWAFNITRQCKDAEVKVFVKQIHLPKMTACAKGAFRLSKNKSEWPEILRVRELPWENDVKL